MIEILKGKVVPQKVDTAKDIFNQVYNPDVLLCLANLSNDEVFTPPEVANQMLDMLPQELFEDPNVKFLDPACKSGVFLREIAKRLIKGLEDKIPDLQERIDHICKEQLYGIAITELTSLLSRRSVYCSKYPNGPFSIARFDNVEGNIRFKNCKHEWVGEKNLWTFVHGEKVRVWRKCKWCGASEEQYGDAIREGLEKHAYEIIHTINPEEIFSMKFDVIISNPPYQLSDGGAQASASPLYHLFVNQSLKLNPRYLTMVIPARWYSGGKGLDQFRENMLNDKHISELHDFPITSDCFPGVNIRGGVCYFLWDSTFDSALNKPSVITHENDTKRVVKRNLKYEDMDIFVRYDEALDIVDKVKAKTSDGNYFSKIVSARKPFGLTTDFTKSARYHKDKMGMKDPVRCIGKGLSVGYVERSDVLAHKEWIDAWKVFVPRANNIGTELNDDNLNAFVGKPNEACTESYIVIGGDLGLTEEQAKNIVSYLRTKFARFCHSVPKVSQDATAKTYRYIPMQNFNKPWADEELYKSYNLTEKNIEFVESHIKPME